ncbi:hypothetical protein OE749_08375 [Aestuariibacter sp. AA17]|uniref:Uncharacterized protein n=1 Tax=Fluctibacter corallii TaxID=2984329 RepID=A0ABT3A810_9ALTE|nr:hypothetical protein [Aestuariibacter sp. AA17]MCV2884709.1 hypothetical protein [Aestuariibacter sp. AA17]
MQRIEIIYELGALEPLQVWNEIANILSSIDDSHSLTIYGKNVKPSKMSEEIKKLKGKAFNIISETFEFHMVTVTNYEQILVQIESKKSVDDWWRIWIKKFIKLRGFVQAWIVDTDFNYWQNVSDPIEYKSRGKSCKGLLMKSNGLPPPLEQLEIDISKNAGLRKLCVGYVEAIGAKMWLSERFLERIGKSIEYISNESGAKITYLQGDIYMLSQPFNSFVDDRSIVEQRKLRKALYG